MNKISFKSLFSKLLEFKRGIAFALILYILWSVIEISIPFLTQLLVDEGIGFSDRNFIVIIIFALVLFNIGGMVADYSKAWVLRNIGIRINITVIEEYYQKLLQKDYSFFAKVKEGQIIQNVSDNIRIESFLTNGLLSFVNATFKLTLFTFILAYFDGLMSLLFFLSIVILIVWDIAFLPTRARIDKERFKLSATIQNEVIQSVRGIFDIKVNNLEAHQSKSWHNLHQYTSNIRLNILQLAHIYQGGNIVISQIRNGAILIFSCFAIIEGNMTLGTLLAIQYILGQSDKPLMDILEVIQERQDAKLSLERLKNVFNDDDIEEKVNPTSLAGDLHFDEVTFMYPDSDKGIHEVDIVFPFGKRAALVGESGNGKSTLMNLVLALYQPVEGEIKLKDEHNRSFTVQQCIFGALSQDGLIFDGSIAFNIALRTEESIDHEKMNEILTVTCIREVIDDLPDKLNTLLGKNGKSLSKGQLQRIMIARALYADSHFLLLDEPTSALDNKTAQKLMANILQYSEGKTLIIATHKLSLAAKMDMVVVLDNGRIVKKVIHDGGQNVPNPDLNKYLA